jgi:hypothetical protein
MVQVMFTVTGAWEQYQPRLLEWINYGNITNN